MLLLYAVDAASPQHEAAVAWIETTLSGDRRVAIPWQTIGSFMRISTQPRVYRDPLTIKQAWSFVSEWLTVGVVWIPPASRHTAAILGDLLIEAGVGANLVPDAQLAALAIEHGLVVQSADTGFARFSACRWENPLTS